MKLHWFKVAFEIFKTILLYVVMHCGEKPEGAMDKSIGRGLHLCVLAFVLYPSRLAKLDRGKAFLFHAQGCV